MVSCWLTTSPIIELDKTTDVVGHTDEVITGAVEFSYSGAFTDSQKVTINGTQCTSQVQATAAGVVYVKAAFYRDGDGNAVGSADTSFRVHRES